METTTIVIILILVGLCLCCCFTLLAGGTGLGAYIWGQQIATGQTSSYTPVGAQFTTVPDYKLIGNKFMTLGNIPNVDACRDKCHKNKFCIGASYNHKKKTCDLHYHNRSTRPKFYTDWEGWSYIERLDPTSRMDLSIDKKMNASGKVLNVANERDCAIRCLSLPDEECVSANYNRETKDCDLLIADKKEDETAFVTGEGITHMYKNGIPGQMCKTPIDCLFGRCVQGICLADDPEPKGEDCVYDHNCLSGFCKKNSFSSSKIAQLKKEKIDVDQADCEAWRDQKGCKGPKCRWSGGKCNVTNCASYTNEDDCALVKGGGVGYCKWNDNKCDVKIKTYEYKCL